MKTTTIGPLTVSELQLGAMLFGTTTPEDIAITLLDRFVEAGGTFIDTSNNYAFWQTGSQGGESETLLGRWMEDRGNRDQLQIATKVGGRPNHPAKDFEDIEGLSRDVIVAQVDASLRRLGTDRIDLYYAHIDDRTTDLEDTLAGFDAVVKAGKVRAIGCSNHAVWRIERAIQLSRSKGWPEYVALQQHHSYYRPRPTADMPKSTILPNIGAWGADGGLGPQHLDYIRFNPQFRVVAYTPMMRGGYADWDKLPESYRTNDNVRRRAALEALSRETGASPSQLALAWMLHSTPAIIPLMAVSTMEQLEENLGALDVTLTKEQVEALDKAA